MSQSLSIFMLPLSGRPLGGRNLTQGVAIGLEYVGLSARNAFKMECAEQNPMMCSRLEKAE